MWWLMACTEPASESLVGSFSVLSYNIHGLPAEVTGDDTDARIEEIAPRLNDFDIIGLQEDWMDDNSLQLQEQSVYSNFDRFDTPRSDEQVYGAGLSFLGTYPITKTEHIYYDRCNGLFDNGADCFASKGFQYLVLDVSGSFSLHIYNTHLEAGNSDVDHDIRSEQLETILAHLNAIEDEPVILMGDFNLSSADPKEDTLLRDFREMGGLRQTCIELACEEPYHIDQIFFRSGQDVQLQVEEWQRDRSFVDSQGVDLSDHPAIVSLFRWQR